MEDFRGQPVFYLCGVKSENFKTATRRPQSHCFDVEGPTTKPLRRLHLSSLFLSGFSFFSLSVTVRNRGKTVFAPASFACNNFSLFQENGCCPLSVRHNM